MKYLSRWQPLLDEDRHTALLFGFMRHAPAPDALDPWLTQVLGRAVTAEPLAQSAFWPRFPSVVPKAVYTEPDLVFRAHDHADLTVVVEVKPGFGGFYLEQIVREGVDVAATLGSTRIVCLLVSADPGSPVDLDEWQAEVARQLATQVPSTKAPVSVELAYASFASLGSAIAACGRALPTWRSYAEDVIAQLRLRGLLEYEGAPMLDDLTDLTVPTAVEAFNRTNPFVSQNPKDALTSHRRPNQPR